MAGDTPHTIASNTCRSSTTTRRAALFRETPVETLERWMLGTAWAMKPERIAGVPTLARIVASGLVRGRAELPDPTTAVPLPEGLCGVVAGDITGSKLIEAYGRSLFPFAHLGPLKWYSPAERCVLFFDEFHMAKTLRRQIRQGRHTVTFDRDFEGVVKACAGRRSGKWHVTWITPRIMHMFAGLFDAGHVHSFEVWNDAGELVGGGYGLALGSVFFTESQFSLERNTSKVGFSVLNWHLAKWGFTLNDGKFPTPTILDMQFRSIPRAELQTHLDRRKAETLKPGRWQVETDLATIAAWQPGGENADASKPPKQSKPKKEKAAVSATSPAASADIPAAVS